MRERDTTADGALDERVYVLQNWRADVTTQGASLGTANYGWPDGVGAAGVLLDPCGDLRRDGAGQRFPGPAADHIRQHIRCRLDWETQRAPGTALRSTLPIFGWRLFGLCQAQVTPPFSCARLEASVHNFREYLEQLPCRGR